MAYSINEKALEKALAYENFIMVYNFLGLKYLILMFLSRDEEAAKVSRQKALSLYRLNEAEQLSDINKRFNNLAKGGRETEHLLSKISQKVIFKTAPEKLKSNTGRIRWHEMKQNYYYFIKHDLKTAIHHNLCKLGIFESQPQLVYSWPHPYLTCIVYLCNHYAHLENREEAIKFAQKLEFETDGHRKEIPVNLCAHFNLTARISQTYLLCHQGSYADAVKKAEEIDMSKLDPGSFVIAKFHHALALFYTGRYDEARKACEELHSSALNIQILLLLSNRILLVMIHHALKNYSLLPHLTSSAAAWAKRNEIKAHSSNELIHWFQNLAKLKPENMPDLFFKRFNKAVQKNTFKGHEGDLDLKRWISTNLPK